MTTIGPFGYIQGWNTKCGPYDIPKDAMIDAQNVEIVNGRIQSKKGNTEWTTGDHDGNIYGMALFQDKIVAAGGGKVQYASSTAAGGWTDITGSATWSTNTNTWMDSLNNILVMGNSSVATPLQWTGTGNVSSVTGTPPTSGACGVMVNNYLFIGNITSYPYRVRWSAILNPNSWPAANYVDVRVNDTEPIVALFPFGEDLLIFKETSIHRFYTNQLTATLGPLVCISETIGCMGPQCVDRLPDGRIAFMGFDAHVYIYDGNSFRDISNQPYPGSNIQPVIDALPITGFPTGCLKVYKGKSQIWVSEPIANYTNPLGVTYEEGLVFIYDYSIGAWNGPYVDPGIYKLINYLDSSSNEYLISASYKRLYKEDNGYILSSGSSPASDTMVSFCTKSIPLGPDSKSFHPASAYAPIYSGTLIGSFFYGANGYQTPSSFANISIAGATQERKKVFFMYSPSSSWNTLQYRFMGTVSNQPWKLSPVFISDEKLEQV